MRSYRTYGEAPYRIAVIHGGPGATGAMAPVARELETYGHGVLEPFQTADSLDGQVEELAIMLREYSNPPVILVGHSWGTWLSCLTAKAYPKLVRKLILIGSAPFEESCAATIHDTRWARLTDEEREDVHELMGMLSDDPSPEVFSRFGALMTRADTFDPLPVKQGEEGDDIIFRPDIFRSVWPEAAYLRKSGKLLDQVARLTCPVTAIHGDYDPHPAAGVCKPLERVLDNITCILLERCGHTPWFERQARDQFFAVLAEEIAD